jgi:hypothetical protein
LLKPSTNPDHGLAANWRASAADHGAPGLPDGGAGVSIGDLSHLYNGAPKPASVTTDPAGLAVAITYDGLPDPPAAAGTYQVEATVTDPAFEGRATATLTIAQAPQTICFEPPARHPLDGPPLDLTATADSGLPVALEILSGPASLSGGQLSFSDVGNVLVLATQAGDGNWLAATPVERSITVTSNYSNNHWRTEHFSATELADPSVSGPDADPDGDGHDNLMEYALATNPRLADLLPPPLTIGQVSVGTDSYLAVTFRHRSPDLGIGYHVEVSSDLTAWDDQAPAVVLHGVPIPNGDGTETVTVRSSVPVGTLQAEFVRLRVTLAP